MAHYWPKETIEIAETCREEWDAMTALVSISSAVAAARSSNGRVTMGKPPVRSVYCGQVIGPNGKPEQHAHVTLTRSVNGRQERVEAESDAQGAFRLQATPGGQLEATGPNRWYTSTQQPVALHAGEQSAAKPLLLEYISVTAGIPVPPRPVTPPKK